jgi:hypothetical protein
MAFSKTPEGDTHSVKRVPSVGSPFLMPSTASDIPQTLNYYNCFPYAEKQFGGPPKFNVQKREAYISALADNTDAKTSANFSNWVLSATNDDNIYFARDDTYYYAQYSGTGSVTVTSIGAETGAYLSAATNGIFSDGSRRIVTANGTKIAHWLEDGSGYTEPAAITPSIDPSAGLVFLNGYLFAVATNRRIYNSTAGGVFGTWATTDFIDAEIYPDQTLYLAKHRNYLVAFGENSTEFFYDGANEVGSPLSRQESYAAKIGAHIPANSYKATCNINDDIYFIGKSNDDTLFLAVVQDFKVKPIDSRALDQVLNSPTDNRIYSIETWTVNNIPMVLIKLSSTGGISTGLVYNPDADGWWTIDMTDIGGAVTTTGGDTTFGCQVFNKTWSSATARYPFFLRCATARTAVNVDFCYPDKDWATSTTAYIWTDVIDMDVNRWKHVYKISAVGNYGANVLTLSFCNNKTYNSYTTMTPTFTQSTLGAENDITWTNPGQFRDFSLRLQMTGAAPATHTGFEIAYNLKMQ